MNTKDSLIDELVGAVDALKAAFVWWEDEVQYLTMGDHGEHNVFDDEPQWVGMARIAIAEAPKPVPIVDESESKVLLKTQLVHLTRGDVNILDGSAGRCVRSDPYKDAEVKRLYHIWKTL